MSLSRVLWKVHSKDHAMAASSSGRHAGDDHDDRVTPLSGTQLLAVANTCGLCVKGSLTSGRSARSAQWRRRVLPLTSHVTRFRGVAADGRSRLKSRLAWHLKAAHPAARRICTRSVATTARSTTGITHGFRYRACRSNAMRLFVGRRWPEQCRARSTRCACWSSSRTTSPARRTQAATSSAGTAPKPCEASRDYPTGGCCSG
jgi:hypothetical protein